MIDLSSFIEANQSSALITDPTGKILEANKQSETILDQPAEQIRGRIITEFLPSLESFFRFSANTKRLKFPIRLSEEHYTSKTDEIHDIEISINELVFSEQQFFWISLNISEVEEPQSTEQEESQFFKKMLKQSRDVIIRLNASNQITYISPSCYHLMGYKTVEVKSKEKFSEFIYEPDQDDFEILWKENLKRRDSFMVNRLRLVHKNGNPVWVEIYIKREFDERGRLVQSIANLRNISERINHHLEIEKIKERYQLAVEAGHTGIWDYSILDDQLFVDNSLKSLLGYSKSENIDETFLWKNLIDEGHRKTLKEAIRQHIKEGKSYFEETFQMNHKRHVSLWVLGRGKIFYENERPIRIIFSVTDITDKIKSNERLRNALINFKAIFDAFPDLFFRLNKLGDFLEIMAGESTDHSILNLRNYEGKNIKEALPASEYEKIYGCLRSAFESGKAELCEYQLGDTADRKTYEARIIAISDNEAIGIVRNITRAVKTNHELLMAKKLAEEALNAKDEFLSMMSHEIRTPLNVVIGMTYLLHQQNPTPDQLKFINTLKFSSDNLLSLINDLLDFSKIKAGKLIFEHNGFNFKEFIWNIFESYKLQLDSSRVELKLNIEEGIPTYVNGDYNRLAQILNNLLSNAQKFTDRGEVCINVNTLSESDEEVRLHFSVSDTGIGIHQDKISTIFEPFQQGGKDTTRRYGGTGLGLTIVKQLIELQGGTISLNSNPGGGSVFSFQLPFGVVAEESISASEDPAASAVSGIQNLKILYAEDIPSNQFLMKGYADLWKFDLDIASNGEQAVNMFLENDYDVILLDLQMPVMDGYQAARKIREIESLHNTQTPIIAVTGDISEKTVQQISDCNMNDYIIKPINPKLMIEKIHDRIREDKPEVSEAISSRDIQIYSRDENFICFDQVDYLYGEVPTQYVELIHLFLDEFTNYKIQMIKSVKEEQFDEFRQIRHSMRSNLRLLKMDKFQTLIDDIRDEFMKDTLPPCGDTYIGKIEKYFDKSILEFESKLRILIE